MWAGWYSFGKYIGVEFDNKIYDLFINFVMNVSFIIPYKGIAFISETAKEINWLEGKLHSITEPAVIYEDGYSLYSLHGVNFEKELWEKITKGTISTKELLSLSNIEQRMAALRVIGVEKILEQGTLVDQAKGYELYEIKGIFSKTAYYLKYKDPSTDRVYCSGIDPEVGAKKDAIRSLCWKFSIDEYKKDEPLFESES